MASSSPYWQEFLDHAELSDVGLRRANNQDSMAFMPAGNEVDFFRRGHVFVVADGMGKHAAGELASKISVDTIPLEYFKEPNAPAPAALKFALEEANRRIHARGTQNPDFKGMGTTTSALVLMPQGALAAHVGDSRVYRLRGDLLEQLTFDHSVAWELGAAAKSGGVEFPANVPKNYITRSLGHDSRVQVDLEGPFPLAEGDAFLLCSDGLSGQLEDYELGTILRCLQPNEAARAFVDFANIRGGPDNITVLLARIGNLARIQGATPPKAPSVGAAWQRVSPVVWVGFGTTTLLTAILFLAAQPLTGVIAAAAALVEGLYVFFKMMQSNGPSTRLPTKPLGKGPHVSVQCIPNDAYVAKLASMLQQLRESAQQQNWKIDWNSVDGFVARARTARAAEQFGEAVRQFCLSISFIMAEIRKQRQSSAVGGEFVDDEP